MGRIIAYVTIANAIEPAKSFRCNALVDTGASHMVLPIAWKERLGDLPVVRRVEVHTVTQATVQGEVCGPVKIQIEGFPPVSSEVLFLDITAENGSYEPLIGYIVLEQSQAAVDMLGHRLLPVPYVDLKMTAPARVTAWRLSLSGAASSPQFVRADSREPPSHRLAET